MENCKRDFKGVWLPKELWFNRELSLQEKCFIAEINSLDNENGCYANNNHFSEIFNLSKNRCTEVIKSLEKKNVISVEYVYEGKTIKKRILRLKEVFGLSKGSSENSKNPIEISKGSSEKCEDRITIENNNIENNNICILSSAREILEYLNQKTNSKFKPTKSTIAFIAARLKEFSIDELKTMIDFKTMEWLNDNKMSKYLQPSTLFRPTNCVNYVEAARKANAVQPTSNQKYVYSFGEILKEVNSLRNAGYTRESMIDRLRRLRCKEEDIQNALSLEGII